MKSYLKIIVLTFVLTNPLFANGPDTIDGRLKEIYQRETFTELIRDSLASYEGSRNSYLLSNKGIISLSKDYIKDVSSWLEQWQHLSDDLDIWSGDLNDLQITAALFLRKQSAMSVALDSQATIISDTYNRLVKELNVAADPGDSNFFAPQISDLESVRQDATESAGEVLRSVEGIQEVVHQMTHAYNWVYLTVQAKKGAIGAAINEAGKGIQTFRDFINAEAELNPITARLNKALEAFETVVFRMQIFKASDDLPNIEKQCRETKKQIKESSVQSDLQTPFLREVSDNCSAAMQRFESLTEDYSTSEVIASMHKANVRQFKNRCRRESAGIDCSVFSWLKDLPPADILSMNDEELRNLEKLWQEVEFGLGELK